MTSDEEHQSAAGTPDPLLVDVGRRVARARGERQLTQSQLAEATGIPLSTIRAIERGRQNTDVLRLAALSVALRIPLFDLLPDDALVRPTPARTR